MTTSSGAGGRPPCGTCAPRARVTAVRNNFIGPCDTTLGLVPVDGGLYACPACGVRYRREVEEATMFPDYDMYYFIIRLFPTGKV